MEKKVKDIEKEVKEVELDEDEYEEISMEERIIGIEKKVNITLLIVSCLVVLSIFTLILSINGKDDNEVNNNTNNNQQSASKYDTSAFKEITASDIQSESKNETIVVWIGRQGCGYCAQYAPNIAEAAKNYGIQAKYIDLAKIVDFDKLVITDATAYDTISNLSGTGDWKDYAANNISGTPLTLIIKNNKVVGGLNRFTDVEEIEKAFEDAGLKK